MRFSVPRSLSPSPVRSMRQSRSVFRAPSDSSDYDDLSSDDDSSLFDIDISIASTSSSGLSESDKDSDESEDSDDEGYLPFKLSLSRSNREPKEERLIEETVSSIRSRTRHNDPYEDWERQTRKDAFHTARKQHSTVLSHMRESQKAMHQREQQQFDSVKAKEMEELNRRLNAIEIKKDTDDKRIRDAWSERNRRLWQRIEGAIKVEEDKLRARLETERKVREEEEKKRLAEEEKRKQEEEKRRKEEEDRRKKVVEERLRKEMEEAERREQEERDRQKKEQEKGAAKMRTSLGMENAEDLWKSGLLTLRQLKKSTMRAIKGPKPPDPEPAGYQAPPAPPVKKIWSAQRRKITPKVGQLTDDPNEIRRITEELKTIIAPIPGMPPSDAQHLHHALLSSVAKAILSQAETEVTANKAQAGPLARVSIALIATYPLLGDIFWAKMCERIGCWVVGCEPITLADESQDSLPEKLRMKRWGMKAEEGQDVQTTRITGVLRLYFRMLFVSLDMQTPQPLLSQFRPGRFWLYLSQLLNNSIMLGRPVAAEAIYVALDEGGLQAKAIWGKQFIKMLQYIYEGVQGPNKERFGGTDVLAQASRARCQLEVEKIMSSG